MNPIISRGEETDGKMIYLFTALYCEAQVFIKHFHLEKNLENTGFQEFYSEAAGVRLTITGVGEIAAAVAVAGACAKYKPKKDDMLLNVGICAHTAGKESVFVCNKITELATGKTFYPDILYAHNFKEEAIVTGMSVQNGEENGSLTSEMFSSGTLYDMEAAAIYQAGAYFFGPHQMMFLKIVSDNGAANLTPKKQAEVLHVDRLMETYQNDLVNWVEKLIAIVHRSGRQEDNISKEYYRRDNEGCLLPENEPLLEKLCADLHCSKVMRDSLEQHIRYMELSGTDYVPVVQEMYREELLPCKDKREGKLRFEELKRRLL